MLDNFIRYLGYDLDVRKLIFYQYDVIRMLIRYMPQYLIQYFESARESVRLIL